MENEKWLPVKNYELLYEVSDKGRVKALKKCWNSGPGGKTIKCREESIMKLPTSNYGYSMISLQDKGRVRKVTVHRLVMEHFVPNLENKPCINHIDRVRTNNCIDNLEWCTYLENNLHSPSTGSRRTLEQRQRMSVIAKERVAREGCIFKGIKLSEERRLEMSVSRKGNSPSNKGKKIGSRSGKSNNKNTGMYSVLQIETGKIYKSINKAAIETGISYGIIRNMCNGITGSLNGYTFKYNIS